MIYLYTGLNGAGKTSSCIFDVLKLHEETGRPVFASGIRWTQLGIDKLGVTMIEPSEWRECPDGSLILVDEAQNSMPARTASKDLPDWINELGTHRHKGHDIFLTTPHPMQIDVFARRLVGVHRHFIRAFSFNSTTQLENEGVMNDPTSKLDNNKAIVTRFKLRKSVYPLYQSATIHTHKARVPVRKVLIGFGALAFLGGGVAMGLNVWHRMTGQTSSPAAQVAHASAGVGKAVSADLVPSKAEHSSGSTSVRVVGSMSRGGRTVYLVADGHGDLYVARNCRVVNDAAMCAFGAGVATYPDVAAVASMPAVYGAH